MAQEFHRQSRRKQLREYYRCVGLELGGTHSSRTSMAVLDYYPKSRRLILNDIDSRMTNAPVEASPDAALIESLKAFRKEAKAYAGLAVHGPTSFPPYLNPKGAKLPLPDKTMNAEVKWMNAFWARLNPKPRPFVPYLQRPAELWIRHMSSERFQITDAFGSGGAPLAARLAFLMPHLPQPIHEVFPRATLTRLVSSLGLTKWLVDSYADVEQGVRAREEFLNQLLKKLPQIFLYNRDLEIMILHLACFNAFIAALSEFLIFQNATENPPHNFPKSATWIHLPRKTIPWEKIL